MMGPNNNLTVRDVFALFTIFCRATATTMISKAYHLELWIIFLKLYRTRKKIWNLPFKFRIWKFTWKSCVTCLIVCAQCIYILLASKINLHIKEDKDRGLYVSGLTEEYVDSAQTIFELMKRGASNRIVAATSMSAASINSL